MRMFASLSALVFLGAVSSGSAMPSAAPLKIAAPDARFTHLEYVQGSARAGGVQHISLPCLDSSMDFGTCPSPREQCYNDCYEIYEAEIFLCLTGAEGILPVQRGVGYGRAGVRHGSCRAQCKQDHPF